MITNPSEVEDFETALHEAGYSRSDFKLTGSEEPFPVGCIAAPRGTVTVTNMKRNISKTYYAGCGSTWPAEFHLDLRQGVFGAP